MQLTRRSFLGTGAALTALGAVEAHAEPTVPAFTLPAAGVRPCLLISSSDYQNLREKWKRSPCKEVIARYTRDASEKGIADDEQWLVLALLTGDASYARRASEAFQREFEKARLVGECVLRGEVLPVHQPRPGATGPRYDFSELRYVHRKLHCYDILKAFDAVPEALDRSFQEHVFWVLERYMSPAIREINARYDDRRHNFHTDNIAVIATAALSFPEHPHAQNWLRYALTDLCWQLEEGVEDGAWHENPRYHGAVLRSLVPLGYALRRNAGVDIFTFPGMQALLDWFVRCQTPPDTVHGEWLKSNQETSRPIAATMGALPDGVSVIPAVGDALWVSYWFTVLAMAAPAYAGSEPDRVERLMWGWKRAGKPFAPESYKLLVPLILIDPDLPSEPQCLESEFMPKAGHAILRAAHDTPEEKYFFLTCGRRREFHWAGHKHRDQNSFSLYAFGVPLALDAGSGPYRSPMQAGWHKATLSHNTVTFGGQNQPPEDGVIRDYVSTEHADYLLGDPQRAATADTALAMQWHRHVLFVKPDYFVIWDFIRSDMPTEWSLHTPAKDIFVGENLITCRAQRQVALDIHVLCPHAPIQVVQGTGRFGNWQTENEIGAGPFTHQQFVRIQNEPATDFLTILYPRRIDSPALKIDAKTGFEHVLEIDCGKTKDTVLLFAMPTPYEHAEQELSFYGRAGLVRRTKDGPKVALLQGSHLTFPHST